MRRARLVPLLFAAIALPAARAAEFNTLSKEDVADGWISLFDGETLFGWHAAGKADWKVADGVISVGQGEPCLLCTNCDFADYVLKVDFRHPAGTNSGVFLRTPQQPKSAESDCYELNIADPSISPFPTGSFVGRKKGTAEDTSDQWRSYEVTAEGAHFTVKLDGKLVLDYTDAKPLGRGRIGLQLNKGRVEFRNVKLKPLSLTSIFNGKDLAGWKQYPGKPSVYSVTPEGELSLVNGPGQLESAGKYGDFVLQLDVMTRGKGINSGIFFRSIPGELCQGYESQIHNGYRDGDRTKPRDGGTGAIYRRQNARKVVADDNAWFTKTLVATGNHMAVWVDGYQVSDWTDERPASDNPREGSRLAAGTLIIQGHDRTTNLLFRKLRVAELPTR